MSTKYIYTFALIMTVLVALLLAGSKVVLGPIAEVNEDIFNKRQILEAISGPLEEAGKSVATLSDQEVLDIFDQQVEQAVVMADGTPIKDNTKWKGQFAGKKIYDGNQYVSVYVRKGGAVDMDHEVDGLSGATVTADGVTDMLYDGLKAYLPYMKEAGNDSSSMNLK